MSGSSRHGAVPQQDLTQEMMRFTFYLSSNRFVHCIELLMFNWKLTALCSGLTYRAGAQ